MFEQLVLVDHPNIVKLHKYWLDVKDLKARVGRAQRVWRGLQAGGGTPVASREGFQPCSFHARALCCPLKQPRVLTGQGPQGADADLPCQVIFITEYVSSGSLKQFLKKTKKNHKAMNARVGSWEQHRGPWEHSWAALYPLAQRRCLVT